MVTDTGHIYIKVIILNLCALTLTAPLSNPPAPNIRWGPASRGEDTIGLFLIMKVPFLSALTLTNPNPNFNL